MNSPLEFIPSELGQQWASPTVAKPVLLFLHTVGVNRQFNFSSFSYVHLFSSVFSRPSIIGMGNSESTRGWSGVEAPVCPAN